MDLTQLIMEFPYEAKRFARNRRRMAVQLLNKEQMANSFTLSDLLFLLSLLALALL